MDTTNTKSETLADQAYDALAKSIVSGELAPGARILEVELAERFGMSRGPLREAMRRLEERRLVERVSQRGVRVVRLTGPKLHGIYKVREALEGMAARLSAQNMADDEIAELREMLEAHERYVRQSDDYSQNQQDWDFHDRIARGSKNEMLVSLLSDDLYQLLKIFRNQHKSKRGRARRAVEEHWRILAAIEDRDPEMAELMMRRHISAALAVFEPSWAEDAAQRDQADTADWPDLKPEGD
ncbi:GntR family transcriptional regulator [Paracoccus sp. TK19116]|uniref:GntR family transcriptional regulator n=1 Tax=Paracoccus albicereus TaxID=2922394 RepID=A0ABT1MUU8_9RHOB|nr:GntR family transcriptional regulator [Paracoccus albicereus]MCQ0972097.1 GntR family transcriptional regulator [Paracoccus albicereus]